MALHLALLAWLGMCAFAAWWQVTRAFAGNSLSYLYSVEWPVFGILGFVGWWALLHQEKTTDEQDERRREFEAEQRARAQIARQLSDQKEDPELAAYNDHLAVIAQQPKRKLFGH
jgi:DNA-binding transcriptional regulator of glucitol operon